MLGATVALAGGCLRRHGWAIVAMAAAAGAFPDWDGMSILISGNVFNQVHRIWGHNLLVASLSGLMIGGLGYLCRLSIRVQRATTRLWQPSRNQEPGVRGQESGVRGQESGMAPVRFSRMGLAEWLIIGWLAAAIHLPADAICSGRAGMMDWPIKPLWPFSPYGWAWPIVPWGDLGLPIIFIGEMFALYRWPRRVQSLAWLTLLMVHGYIGLRWLLT